MNSSSPRNKKLLELLKNMKVERVQYPEELLSARRAAFMEQVEEYNAAEVDVQPSSQDQKVIGLLEHLKNIPEKYPPQLFAARRVSLVRQIAWMNWVKFWVGVRTAIQKRISVPAGFSWTSYRKQYSASLMVASLALAAFVGVLFLENQTLVSNLFRAEFGIVKSGRMITTDAREESIICKPGYVPPLCLAGEFDQSEDLTYQGNGAARPAVAKDTIPGHGNVHQAAYVNDGLYGPGASWVSNSPNSWIKIDLGKATSINMIQFGRDRLGEFNDRDPGQFVIALAISENVYADGNNSNDEFEYTEVYHSEQAGFKGKISGAETVTAMFKPRMARYIKITFQNKGTAIDEVEAFLVRSPELANETPKDRKEEQSENPVIPPVVNTSLPENTPTSQPVDTATPLPTYTPIPTDTATPIPTNTPLPTNTATPIPTNTPLPTNTATPIPTNTPLPTDTPTPEPTNTPLPTNTPPEPTSTPVPTDTPSGPTSTPMSTDMAESLFGTPLPEDWPKGFLNYLTMSAGE